MLGRSASAINSSTYTIEYLPKPRTLRKEETKHLNCMKIQQGTMLVKVTLILLMHLKARTPTHLAYCHIRLGKVMSFAQQAVLILHLF